MSMFAVALLMADFKPYKLDIFLLDDHLIFAIIQVSSLAIFLIFIEHFADCSCVNDGHSGSRNVIVYFGVLDGVRFTLF